MASLSRDDYRIWIDAYDGSGIVGQPPETLRTWMASAAQRTVFSSSLERSIQSAKCLSPSGEVRSDAIFNEAPVAIPSIPCRMSSTSLTLMGRALWLLGVSADEDVAACRVRAAGAAELLVQSAGSVETLLVGHGWMNRMIASELRRRGFSVRGRSSSDYWSRTSFGV